MRPIGRAIEQIDKIRASQSVANHASIAFDSSFAHDLVHDIRAYFNSLLVLLCYKIQAIMRPSSTNLRGRRWTRAREKGSSNT